MSKEKGFICMDRHHKKGRFMEACLLCLLREEDDYGYGLVQRLEDFNFNKDEINMSIIYRNLKRMEDEKFVLSKWMESEEGPNKKIYSITSLGQEALDNWIILIKDRKKRIQSIIKKYEDLE